MSRYCPTFSLKGLCRHRTISLRLEKFRRDKIGDGSCCESLGTAAVDDPVLHPAEPKRRKQVEDTAAADCCFVREISVQEPRVALSIMNLGMSRRRSNNSRKVCNRLMYVLRASYYFTSETVITVNDDLLFHANRSLRPPRVTKCSTCDRPTYLRLNILCPAEK